MIDEDRSSTLPHGLQEVLENLQSQHQSTLNFLESSFNSLLLHLLQFSQHQSSLDQLTRQLSDINHQFILNASNPNDIIRQRIDSILHQQKAELELQKQFIIAHAPQPPRLSSSSSQSQLPPTTTSPDTTSHQIPRPASPSLRQPPLRLFDPKLRTINANLPKPVAASTSHVQQEALVPNPHSINHITPSSAPVCSSTPSSSSPPKVSSTSITSTDVANVDLSTLFPMLPTKRSRVTEYDDALMDQLTIVPILQSAGVLEPSFSTSTNRERQGGIADTSTKALIKAYSRRKHTFSCTLVFHVQQWLPSTTFFILTAQY